MTLCIRTGCLEDYEAVNEIANEVFFDLVEELPHLFRRVAHSIPLEEYASKLENPDVFVHIALREEDGRTAGFLITEMRRSPEHDCTIPRTYGYVSYFGVKAEFQKLGYGRLMFERCMAEVSRRGGRFLELKVWEFNEKAIRFYEAFGMQTVNRTMEMPLGREGW